LTPGRAPSTANSIKRQEVWRLILDRMANAGVTSKALWYIESHLSGATSLDDIADAAQVSRFHLSRAFSAATGCCITNYLRARRLSEATKALAQGAPDILAVALDAGYGSHEAFTRAVRQHFGLTPEQVRALASTETLKLQEPLRMDNNTIAQLAPPRIVNSDVLLIFGLGERCRSNARMPSQWDRFLPHLGNISNQVGNVAYGVICNSDEAGTYEYICGVEVSEFPSHPPEFARLRIPPQTYAVFKHREHISAIAATWKAIWNQALPDYGYQASDGPAFERYAEEFDGRTGLGGLEIWIPIKA
jgi:AraC family transcriptional regulator